MNFESINQEKPENLTSEIIEKGVDESKKVEKQSKFSIKLTNPIKSLLFFAAFGFIISMLNLFVATLSAPFGWDFVSLLSPSSYVLGYQFSMIISSIFNILVYALIGYLLGHLLSKMRKVLVFLYIKNIIIIIVAGIAYGVFYNVFSDFPDFYIPFFILIVIIGTSAITYSSLKIKGIAIYLKTLFLNALYEIIPPLIVTIILGVFVIKDEFGFYLGIGAIITAISYTGLLIIISPLYFLIGKYLEKKTAATRKRIFYSILFIFVILLFAIPSLIIYQRKIEYNKYEMQEVAQAKEKIKILEPTYIPTLFNKYKNEENACMECYYGNAVHYTNRFFCEKPIKVDDLRTDKGYLEITQTLDGDDDYAFEHYKEYGVLSGYDYEMGDFIETRSSKTISVKNKGAIFNEKNLKNKVGETVANEIFWRINNSETIAVVSYGDCLQTSSELLKIANSLK